MPKKPAVRVVAVASAKGGSGKTTLSAMLSVRAAADSTRVALIDLDPQQSLTAWWKERASRMIEPLPTLFEGVHEAREAIEHIVAEGFEWVFIDTPPAIIRRIGSGVASSDLVLIPTRVSAQDLRAAKVVVDMCDVHGKPFAFIINSVPANYRKLLESTLALLREEMGYTVLEPHVAERMSYVAAMTVGRSAAEVERRREASIEIEALWQSLLTALDEVWARSRKRRA